MNRFTPLFVMTLAFAVSCSSVQKSPEAIKQKLSEKRVEEIDSYQAALKAKANVESRLGSVTDEAIAAGPEAMRYLSTDLFFKANDASLKGDSYSASIIFKYIVKLNPNDIYIRKKYAVELIKSNQLVKAKDELVFLVSNSKDKDLKEKANLLLAGVYSALKNKSKSIKLYKAIVDQTKGEIPEACIFLSKAYVAENKYKRAFSVLDFCRKSSVKNRASFTYFKAKLDFDRNRMKSAIQNLRLSLREDKDHYQSILLLGHIYELKSQNEKALKLYERFIKRKPNSYSVLSKYVNLLFSEGKYEGVIPHLERLLAIDEDNLNLKVRLGVLYTEVGKIDEAKSIFREILKVVPDSDKVLYYLASLYQQTAENESAIEYYSKISDTSALYHESNIQIAQILNVIAQNDRDSNIKKGEDRFISFINKKSQKSDGLNVELSVILAGYQESNKDFRQAIQTMESVKDVQGFSEGHDYYLAALYERVKEYGKAEAIVRKMLERNPENPHALNFIGYSILERGNDFDKAYEYISKAVKLKPNDGYIRDSLGWYYYKKGDFKNAFKETYKAWKLVQDDVVITKHLALIYKAMNNYDKAKEYYVEALKNCKVESEREEVLRGLEDLESLRLPASR
ncbi:tetratricopeptide repeat protein [Bacteriovorax sp. DB6_IX]|uniref:tetratricopeptide repeat protein n=1 Tax=Bacteriovorax sp. DB6_IX TaxID=1353530 RepID=UPI00038A2E85|nr:tetratricopeptide repeat protein [Bacteriovorax sp. DB6_IX]EQC51952.1 tetratricopeptide repeat protein [Bacteriovorax sp. DB6_IX]